MQLSKPWRNSRGSSIIDLCYNLPSLSFSDFVCFQEEVEDLSSELGELSISLCHNPTDQKLMVKVNCARGLQQITKDGRLSE